MSKDSKPELIQEISELARVSSLTTELYEETVCEALGVNRTDLHVLDILERVGPLTAGKLAKETGLSPGAMTAAIDRLEEAGHVRRVRDSEDRRRVTVEITQETRKLAWEFYGPMKEAHDRALAGFTLAELETIRDYWRRAIEAGEGQVARLQRQIGSKAA
jgi:DNA-binding MarR family transcriptional regulator